MRVYISGPITGHERTLVRERFADAAAFMLKRGHSVINPMDIAGWGLSWRVYMAIAKVILASKEIDVIYMMPGWSWSKGCKLELKWAKEYGIPVKFTTKAF